MIGGSAPQSNLLVKLFIASLLGPGITKSNTDCSSLSSPASNNEGSIKNLQAASQEQSEKAFLRVTTNSAVAVPT